MSTLKARRQPHKNLWTLTPAQKNGREVLTAKASDVPEATTMEWSGNSIHMAYTLRYGEPGDTIDLNMDDWMFHVADGVVVNETRMTKFHSIGVCRKNPAVTQTIKYPPADPGDQQ